MLIDAHQHFWNLADRTGHWPPAALAAIYRDFGPADLRPELQRCEVAGTVLVQSLPTIADTHYLLEIAQRSPFVLGVVGWVDLLAADAPAQIAALARHPKLKGLRPMLQDIADTDWITHPALDPALHAMQTHGLVFDALVLPRHLPALQAMAQRHSSLSIVIDHAAKPEIALARVEPWRAHMEMLASLPQVHCKLFGLLTEAGAHPTAQALGPYVDHVLKVFGMRRLMWGSDWPVLELAADYPGWLAMARALCRAHPGMDDAGMAAIFGGNTRRLYRLD
ncbi:putative TIM-barrel fold metal-dependent hydrolase [Polaromonas sp. CF318]|uniref:amidohydrolase family protein n=1 Tax=Polaromonas sp. CF318 TaxID=1144318 RepID=UPI0002710162|nr:amidohydrolase family protein [Polaromonas sp. CF318]EJL82163.1 putative TIM-barrel fold metal-dependent hydrolase [Polaromonas sp. CF318]